MAKGMGRRLDSDMLLLQSTSTALSVFKYTVLYHPHGKGNALVTRKQTRPRIGRYQVLTRNGIGDSKYQRRTDVEYQRRTDVDILIQYCTLDKMDSTLCELGRFESDSGAKVVNYDTKYSSTVPRILQGLIFDAYAI